MLKHLMNGGSLKSLMLRDKENEQGSTPEEERNKLRASIANNTSVTARSETEQAAAAEGDPAEGEEEAEEVEEEEAEVDPDAEVDADGNPIPKKVEETEEQKKEREAQEKIAAKAKRKDDRMQRRIDEAVAERNKAREELEAIKKANPDKKLTEEEVEARAEAKAAQKLAEKELEKIQNEFDADCDKLQKGAKKFDPKFDDNIADIADQFGPIPSFMIGVLSDLDNGDEVLAHIASDDEVAEKIYSFKTKPAKMTKAIVDISTALAEAKKVKPKPISKVPNPVAPVNGRRVQSAEITGEDTKPENMHNYARKRALQMEARRKAGGY